MRININGTALERRSNNVGKKSFREIDRLNVSMKHRINSLMIHDVYVDNSTFKTIFSQTLHVKRRVSFGLYTNLEYNYGKWMDNCDVCQGMTSNEFIYETIIFSNIQYVTLLKLCDICLKDMKCQDVEQIQFKYEDYNFKFREYISSTARLYLDKQLYKILFSKNII
jgi:hypothetical protein